MYFLLTFLANFYNSTVGRVIFSNSTKPFFALYFDFKQLENKFRNNVVNYNCKNHSHRSAYKENIMSFKIFTDSSCNLTDEIIDKYDIGIINLCYVNNDELYPGYVKNNEGAIKSFYEMLRNKCNLSTTCANSETYIEAFEPYLKDGNDLLYISFSSGLSQSFYQSVKAVEFLKEKYPNRKIHSIDTLNGSLGQGLVVLSAAREREKGKSFEEVVEFSENTKMNTHSLFTVKTLEYLARGGRISKAAYFVSTIADIKPTMHVNASGKLVADGKVIGRKRSIVSLADSFVKLAINPEEQTVCISHGDCIEDAKLLAELIKKRVNVKEFLFSYIDPTIAVHSGPDTLAVCFYGVERT